MHAKSTILTGVSILFIGTSINSFAQSGQKWSTSGNSTSNNNFLGTTNQQDLILKANNTEGFRLQSDGDIILKTDLLKIKPNTTNGVDLKLQNNNSLNGGLLIGINAGNGNGNNALFKLKENKDMLFFTNNTEQFRILGNGNIGIGTSSPTRKLEVNGDASVLGGFHAAGPIKSETGFKFPDGTTQTTAASAQQGSETNPFSELFVSDYAKFGNNSIWVVPGGANNNIYSDNGPLVINPTGVTTGAAGHPISAGENTLINPDAGNVGIGISGTPSHKLSIGMSDPAVAPWAPAIFDKGLAIGSPNESSAVLLSNQGLGNPIKGMFAYDYGSSQYLDLYLGWGGATGPKPDVLLAYNGGKVGIGNQNPQESLHVEGNGLFSSGLNQNIMLGGWQLAGPGGVSISTQNDANSAHIPLLFAASNFYFHSGNVGIGTATPGGKLDVNGKFKVLDNGNVEMDNAGPNIHMIDNVTGPGSPAPTDFQIRADNGHGRMISKDGISFFINSDNNANTDDYFAINANDSHYSGQTQQLFKVGVNGVVYTHEIVVKLGAFPDYVFANDYELMELSDLGDYIDKNKHLPNMPSAKEVEEDNIGLGKLQVKLVEKVEELTLYILELKKENEAQQELINKLIND
jgi:hypothetical protein